MTRKDHFRHLWSEDQGSAWCDEDLVHSTTPFLEAVTCPACVNMVSESLDPDDLLGTKPFLPPPVTARKASPELLQGIFSCSNMGISHATPTFVNKTGYRTFEARVGISLFGEWRERSSDGHKNKNPFSGSFDENYCKGKGVSEKAALEALKLDLEKTSETLWI
jgi:hypothetical protein